MKILYLVSILVLSIVLCSPSLAQEENGDWILFGEEIVPSNKSKVSVDREGVGQTLARVAIGVGNKAFLIHEITLRYEKGSEKYKDLFGYVKHDDGTIFLDLDPERGELRGVSIRYFVFVKDTKVDGQIVSDQAVFRIWGEHKLES